MNLIVKHFSELTTNELYALLRARAEVFVVEQQCPYQDLDNKDLNAYHVYLLDDSGKILAACRVLDKNVSYDVPSIGRMITTNRGKGYGLIVMNKAIEVARDKYDAKELIISAQKYAVGFYNKCGFIEYGESYLEDDIPHIHMKYIYK